MASGLTVKINEVTVDCVNVKLNFRTINQGHMMFILTLDNYGGQYDGDFDANDPVEVYFENVLIFKGYLDSDKHLKEQTQKWNLSDYLRVAGRDLSQELSNLKYTQCWPDTAVETMISEALVLTGCTIGFGWFGAAVTIGGHTSEDQYLLDLVREVLQKAGYEGYVTLAKTLQTFPVGSASYDTGITIGDSNCLGIEFTEIEGSNIRNFIDVYGRPILTDPEDKDARTESALDWTASVGTVGCFPGGGSQKVGDNYIVGYTGADGAVVTFKRTIPLTNLVTIQKLYLWYEIQHVGCTLAQIRLHAPDNANYFYYNIGTVNQWYWLDLPLGPDAEYSAESNPDGIWSKQGNPNWWNINAIEFHNTFDANDKQVSVDGMYFYPKRCHGICWGIPGYVLWLPMDGGAGLTAFDRSLFSNDGTINGASWVAGKFGKALSFDGDDDYINVLDASSLQWTDKVTVECWIKPTDFAVDHYFFCKNGGHFYMRVSAGGTQIRVAHTDLSSVTCTWTVNLALDTWYHIVYTYDGVKDRLYKNGDLVTAFDMTGTYNVAGADLWIGKGYADPFEGLIDEVRIYKRVLSDAEIKENYEIGYKYGKRELTKITEATTNDEAQKDAEETLAQTMNPIQSLKVTTPASTFVVGGAWKGLVGHRISVYGTTYRIIDLTVDIAPYQNLQDGYDAIAVFNCVPVSAKIHPDSYAPVMTPKAQVASILRKYEMKNEWKRGG